MSYLGDLRLGDTLDFKFCTVQSTGAPTTLAGSPVISAYPSNSTTQLTAGITLSVDFDSVTGLNQVRVVASGGNGYLTATNYDLVITTGTVNSVSAVGYVVGSFSIENRSAVMPTTAARTLDVSATGEAGVDWANVGSPTTALGLTGTTISTSQVAASVTGNVGGNVTGSVGSVASGGITNASLAVDTGFKSIRSNTAQAGAAGTVTLDASSSATDSFYVDAVVVLTGGTGAGQVRLISAYVGATKVASVTPNWTTNPDNTSTFALLPVSRHDIGAIVGSVPNALISGRVDSNAQVVGTGAIVSGSFAANAIDSGALATTAANEIRDAVWAQAMTELAAVPGVTDTTLNALTWLFELSRNKVTQTATTQLLRNDADAATIGTSTVSDDGTTFIRGKFA